jgi:hypothetical protein
MNGSPAVRPIKHEPAWKMVAAALLAALPLAAWRGGPMESGQTVQATLTLITLDRHEVACQLDRTVDGQRCEFPGPSAEARPSTTGALEEADTLAPYLTVTRTMFLLPGLFKEPAIAARYRQEPPDGVPRERLRRFQATCQLRLREKIPELAVRWERSAAWGTAHGAWVADVLSCRVHGNGGRSAGD